MLIPMTADQYKKLCLKNNLDPEKLTGNVNVQNVGVAWEYVGESQQLSVDIQHHPMLLPKSLIESKIHTWIAQEVGG